MQMKREKTQEAGRRCELRREREVVEEWAEREEWGKELDTGVNAAGREKQG